MAMPKSKRKIKKLVSVGAKPEAASRKGRDVQHEDGLAAESIGETPESKRTDRARGQGQKHRVGYVFDIYVERRRDVLEHEHHQKEIEGVQRPAEISGYHDILLASRPLHLAFPQASPDRSRRSRNCRHLEPGAASIPRLFGRN
jgi:hypothetical protein